MTMMHCLSLEHWPLNAMPSFTIMACQSANAMHMQAALPSSQVTNTDILLRFEISANSTDIWAVLESCLKAAVKYCTPGTRQHIFIAYIHGLFIYMGLLGPFNGGCNCLLDCTADFLQFSPITHIDTAVSAVCAMLMVQIQYASHMQR